MDPRHADALLIGGGVAAARCARTLRRGGFGGSIMLVGEEATPPYNRPPLSKELLRGEVPEELVLAEPVAWYERRDVELLLGAPAALVDPEERLVVLADGQRIQYDQLLLATGAAPRRPPLPGAEHALLLRTLADALAIRQRAIAGARAVVIGGGFIGVEVAASLAARGCAVVVIERAAALWGGTLGSAVSEWAMGRLARAGVEVRLEASVTSIGPDAVAVAEASLPADVVIAGVGVAPRVELAVAAGLAVDDGVVVDERQAAAAGAVFAAGDVARPDDGPRVEHWHAARESGERAAMAMLGQPVPPRRAPWVFSEFADATLDVVGWAPRWDDLDVRDGWIAYLVDGRVAQLAILDGAVPVDAARTFVEQRPAAARLAELAGA